MIRVKRLPDWDKRLFKFLLERASATHQYGGHDCCMFTCDGVQVETGTDLALDWRGLYDSFESAKYLVRSRFKRGLMPAIIAKAKEFDIPEVDRELAMRGDVAAVKYEGQLALGLVDVGRIIMANHVGIHSLPISIGLRFWHIGF